MGLHSRADSVTTGQVRSRGPLLPGEMAAARTAGHHLSFDPAQNGWVDANTVDDICANVRRPGWPAAGTAKSRQTAITLRDWTFDDAAQFRDLLDNPAVWEHLPNTYPGPISINMARGLIDLSHDAELHTVKAVVIEDEPVGQVRLDYSGQEPELSYWLGQQHWGKGIASRAVTAFMRACISDNPEMGHVIARVKPENHASRRILEKAGFLPESQSNATPDWIILRSNQAA